MSYTKSMPLGLTNDYIFRYVFGRKESTPMLLDLVNAVLSDSGSSPVVSLELQNPINTRDAYWAKETVLDIKALGEDRRLFDIEMQVSEDPNFVNRSLYYGPKRIPARLIVETNTRNCGRLSASTCSIL